MKPALFSSLAFLALLLAPSAQARSQPDITDIVHSLEADPFWTNRPITVQFTETIALRNGTRLPEALNNVYYQGLGVLTKDGYRALTTLDGTQTSAVAAETTAIRKFFIKSNDFVMSYFVNSTNTAGRHRKGTLGEATIGTPACNCTEKFWSFPMTPAVVAQKLKGLKNATCTSTNFNGAPAALVAGMADDEKAEMEWQMLFTKAGNIWRPVKTEVYFQNQLLSTIEAFFNQRPGYSIDKIRLTLFRAGEAVGTFSWDNIKASIGDDTARSFAGMDVIPAGVIVTDYRFKKPAIYLMAKAKTAAAPEPKIVRLDVPPAEKQKLPENAVQVVIVRLALITLTILPIGWAPRFRSDRPARVVVGGRFTHYFVRTAAVILSVTAIAKLVSMFSNAPLMLQPDPLLEIPFRYLLLAAALAELSVAAACVFTKGIKRQVVLITWLSSAFLAYRIGVWFIDWHRPCHCLGDLTEMLHMSSALADNIMKIILLFLLLGSYTNLFLLWRQGKTAEPTDPYLESENLVESI